MSEAEKLNSSVEPTIDRFGDEGGDAVHRSAHALSGTARKRLPRRMANVALILSLVGLVAFAAGAAVASAVLAGSVDLQTGWVKDAATTIKDLAQHFKKQ